MTATLTNIGSGTIISGKRIAYVNDTALTSGSIVLVDFLDTVSLAAGAGGLKCIEFTAGSPANGQAIKITLNGTNQGNVDFNYSIAK